MQTFKIILYTLLIAALLSACAPQSAAINTEYILTTQIKDGGFTYLGVSDGIAGLSNPALHAAPGETITLILINGGEGTHNISFPIINVQSGTLTKKGESTALTFTVPMNNHAIEYLDSTHSKVGMRGVLLVGSANAAELPAADSPPSTTAAQAVPVSAAPQESGNTIAYTLESALTDGKMVFMGKGGDIDGKANPNLTAQAGDRLKVTLISGEGAEHDIFFEAFNAKSENVSGQGKSVTIEFVAEKEGTFPYFCTVPGHRPAGMEGKLIVAPGSGLAAAPASDPASAPADAPAADTAMSMPAPAAADAKAVDITRDPTDLPGPLAKRGPLNVRIDLETVEVSGLLADGTTYTYWTFNGLVPGPFLRVRVGDTVEVHLKNSMSSSMMHSVDFHAVTGPGGGAVGTQTKAGEETMFTFKALNPGLYVYHCATPMVALHISNGMYGLILVEPEGGLPIVDREFYVMQGELYTTQPFGTAGAMTADTNRLLNETPDYFVFNGASMALAGDKHALHAKTGETVRIFFGVGGPNFISSFHVIGEIFDRVYDQASLTSAPLTNVQTTIIPPGGATLVEFALQVPGRYILVDHALARLNRGLAGYLYVEGDPAPAIFNAAITPGSGH